MFKRLLWLALLAMSHIANAQTPSTQNPTKLDFNIPSPNAAGFEKFGNVPVNYFNGLPNISVPIYNVVAGKHSLPISISYHAGGIRVDDISGDAGLGWNLSAGYKITRVLRGKKDELGYVGHNDAAKIIQTTNPQSQDATADSFKASADNIWDTQPDEFNFSIGSASGKFILSPDKVIIMPDQDIKVAYSTVTGAHYQFVLTDAMGVQYHFNDFSTTSTTDCQGSSTMDYASSWSISKIIYPDTRDSIRFAYSNEMQAISSISESRNYDYEYMPRPVKYKVCETYANINEKKIAAIYFPNGKVIFTYDKPKLELAGTNALTKAEVYDNSSQLFITFRLGYSYYNSSSTNNLAKKLRLDSVYTITPDQTITGKYVFSYNGDNIPPYQSKSKDHWGFYNGKSNSSLIPGNTFSVYDANGLPVPVPGGNRDVDPSYSSKGVLNKIVYPAGGSTLFEYESNDAGSDCQGAEYIAEPIYAYTNYSSASSCKYINSPGYQNNTTTFTAPSTQSATVQAIFNAWNCTGNTKKYILKDLTDNIIKAQGTADVNVQFIGGHQYSLYTETDCRNAEANMLDCDERISAAIVFTTVVGHNKNKLTGGIRIKKITDYDQYSTISNVRSFQYQLPSQPDRSSGILTFKPKYDYSYIYVEQSGYPIIDYKNVTSYAFTSDANNMSQSSEASVVYKYVRETFGAIGEGGSTLYNYSTPYRSCEVSFPFAPSTSYRHRNGQLLSSVSYDKLGILTQKVINYYNYIPSGSTSGWKVAYQKVKSSSQLHDVFAGIIYNYISEKIRLDSTTTETFFNPNTISQTQAFAYLGNVNHYPYKSLTKNSQGNILTAFNWRASDFTVAPTSGLTGATAALRYMQDNHITDVPVESYTLEDGLVTGGSISEYFLFNDLDKAFLLPSQTFKLSIATPISDYSPLNRNITTNQLTLSKDTRYASEVRYTGYNDKGNPAIMKADGKQSISLIWGYGYNYPIAKVLGDSIYKCGFTSFEPDAYGNWNYIDANTTPSIALTGRRSFPLTAGNVTWTTAPIPGMSEVEHSGTQIPGNFIVSYWKTNGDVFVNGTSPVSSGATTNGWTYYEHLISNPTGVTVTGTANIDELRLYQVGTSMEGYTYEMLKGITSGSDNSGHVSFFEYDQLGRLILVKDEQGNIVKRHTYQYQGN